jgi:hypothetical protein
MEGDVISFSKLPGLPHHLEQIYEAHAMNNEEYTDRNQDRQYQ